MYNRTHEKQTVPSRDPVVHETSQTTNQKTESNAAITTPDLRSCRACRSSWEGGLEEMILATA